MVLSRPPVPSRTLSLPLSLSSPSPTVVADPTPAAETEASDPAPVVTANEPRRPCVAAANDTGSCQRPTFRRISPGGTTRSPFTARAPTALSYDGLLRKRTRHASVPGTKIRVTGYKSEMVRAKWRSRMAPEVGRGRRFLHCRASDVTDLLGTGRTDRPSGTVRSSPALTVPQH